MTADINGEQSEATSGSLRCLSFPLTVSAFHDFTLCFCINWKQFAGADSGTITPCLL
jgi:hypothetical protein